MNPVTGFVLSINFSLLFLYPAASMVEIVGFNLAIVLLTGMDKAVARGIYRPIDRLRTWAMEPIGFFVIGIPLGLVVAEMKSYYFYLTVLPYGIHIILAYLSAYNLRPFAPFHDFVWERRGVAFTTLPRPPWQKKEYGVSELYFLVISLFALAYTWTNLV